MCLFTHAAAGALAGALSPKPFLAPILALGSHILLDVLPHYDFEKMRHEFLYAGIVVAAVAIGGAFSLSVFLGILFGVLPDLENLLWKLGRIRDDQKIFPGHRKLLPHGAVAGGWSVLVQGAFSVCVVLFLIRRSG